MIRWIWDSAKYHNSHSSKSIRAIKLFFCQNGVHLGKSFWPKDSFVTLILFELWLLWYLAQSQIHRITLYYNILFDSLNEFLMLIHILLIWIIRKNRKRAFLDWIFYLYIRGHSISTWTEWVGEGVKKWQNSVHEVVECPLINNYV